MQSRRKFIQQSSLFSAAILVSPHWLLNDYDKKDIGLQLYTVRDAMAKDPKGTLTKVANIGYSIVEGATYTGDELYYGMKPNEFRDVLNHDGLRMLSSHYQLGGLTKTAATPKGCIMNDWQRAIDDAKIVGQQYMVCAWLPEDCRKSIDDYKRVAEIFNKTGETCKKSGIKFCYHNHNFEFPEIDGQVPYEVLLNNTDPELVHMEMDIYWVRKAGWDPLKLFKEHPGRFILWHVKDMDNTPQHSFAAVGTGIIDFKKIFAHAKEAGMQHFFVEQDICPDGPFVDITKSYTYLRKMLG
jgi:sugar phosphate isomerase/epimerase